MAVAYFVIPYEHIPCPAQGAPPGLMNARRCWLAPRSAVFFAAGGDWTETEVEGDRTLVRAEGPDAAVAALRALVVAEFGPGAEVTSRTPREALFGTPFRPVRYNVARNRLEVDTSQPARPHPETHDSFDARGQQLRQRRQERRAGARGR